MPLDLNQFATKLRRSRTQLQLSIAEISEATGLAIGRLEGFEAASMQPNGDDILVLADFFACDYRFFVSNERLAAFEQTDSLYRMHGGEFSKEDRRNILEFIFLCECEDQLERELELHRGAFEFTPRGSFNKGQGEAAAQALRAHFNYAPNPVPNDIMQTSASWDSTFSGDDWRIRISQVLRSVIRQRVPASSLTMTKTSTASVSRLAMKLGMESSTTSASARSEVK